MAAIQGWLPGWTDTYSVSNTKQIWAGQNTPREIAADLRRELQRKQATIRGRKVARGAFPAFAGQKAPEPDEQETETEPETGTSQGGNKGGKSSKKKAHKRKQSDGQESSCYAYGLRHRINACMYAFPELRASWFKPNKKREQEVEQKIKADSQLRDQIERIKGKKQKKVAFIEEADRFCFPSSLSFFNSIQRRTLSSTVAPNRV